jgi:cytochrome c peroxidase
MDAAARHHDAAQRHNGSAAWGVDKAANFLSSWSRENIAGFEMSVSLTYRHSGWRLCLAAGVLAALAAAGVAQEPKLARAEFREFVRPDVVPVPEVSMSTAKQIALGAALFNDTRLSRDGAMSCATCHDPARSFTDGESRGKGVAGVTLRRNTPTLWNLAWGESFFWDGRAATLEAQARGPIEHPLEMDLRLADVVPVLKGDPNAVAAFTDAFGADGVTEDNILKALAAFERTLVSPKTRFDRWVEGDDKALTPTEIKGFELFRGRAGCSKCHSGWRFTDEGYHDVGLPGTADMGRGEVADAPLMDNAFKTPTLRELVWTAPYMHDGSLGTIEAANDHYFGGVEKRPSTSPDVPLIIPVFTAERQAITAFLRTLSSDAPPQPVTLPLAVQRPETSGAVVISEVKIRGRRFEPSAVRISKSQSLEVYNDDGRSHALRGDHQYVSISGETLSHGQRATLTFAQAGVFDVKSPVHPGLKLRVEIVDEETRASGPALPQP